MKQFNETKNQRNFIEFVPTESAPARDQLHWSKALPLLVPNLTTNAFDLNTIDIKHPLIQSFNIDNECTVGTNLILYGPNGCGKTTQLYALLSSFYGKTVYNFKYIEYECNKKIVYYKKSKYIIEFNPIELNNNDYYFIQSFIIDYINLLCPEHNTFKKPATKTLDNILMCSTNIQLQQDTNIQHPSIIIITNAEKLSYKSQMILRKIIEKYQDLVKFIFETNNLNAIIGALQSRCLNIRIPMPSLDIIFNIANKYYGSKEYNDYINEYKIYIEHSLQKKSMSEILNTIELIVNDIDVNYDNKYDNLIKLIDNYKYNNISAIREIIYNLYISNDSNNIITYLTHYYIKKYSNNIGANNISTNNICFNLINKAAEIDYIKHKSNKDFIHIEYFIISLINIIHNSNINHK